MRHKVALMNEQIEDAHLGPTIGTPTVNRCNAACQHNDVRLDGSKRLGPDAVYTILDSLVRLFDRVERLKVFTRKSFNDANSLAKKFKSIAKALDGKRSRLERDGATNCRKLEMKYSCDADIINHAITHDNREGSDLESFIRGPLSQSYRTLFGRRAARTPNGPFVRFCERFFGLVEYRVKSGTIISALKGPRAGHR
jgi:hypothetical protein